MRVEGTERERAGERMMEGCCGLRCVGGSEGDMGGKGSRGAEEPMAMRTLWLDNEEVPRCQPTPFTLHGSDPKVSTS